MKRNTAGRWLCTWGFVVISRLAIPQASAADVLRVEADGSGEWPTIQAAVDESTVGDVIELGDGVFMGEGNREIDYGGKAIHIRSESGEPHSCIIDCQDDTGWSRGFSFVSGEEATSILEGVMIVNGTGCEAPPLCYGGAILCLNARPTIVNCVFYANSTYQPDLAGMGGAIWAYCDTGGGPTVIDCVFESNRSNIGGALFGSYDLIQNCTFIGNEAVEFGRGGAADVWMAMSIEHCSFVDNEAAFGAAVSVGSQSSIALSNCVVAFNRGGAGIEVLSGGGVALECCDLFGNEAGDWIGAIATQVDERGNLCLDPLFCAGDGSGLPLCADSPCAPEHSPACGLIGAWPVGCGPSPVMQVTWGLLKSKYR